MFIINQYALFRNRHGFVQCKLKSAKYNYDIPSYGGSNPGGLQTVGCRLGFVAIGKMCVILPFETEEKSHAEASSVCLDKDAILYAPMDQVQNAIIKAMLQNAVSLTFTTELLICT